MGKGQHRDSNVLPVLSGEGLAQSFCLHATDFCPVESTWGDKKLMVVN